MTKQPEASTLCTTFIYLVDFEAHYLNETQGILEKNGWQRFFNDFTYRRNK